MEASLERPRTDRPTKVLIYAPYTGSGGVRRLVLRMLQTWMEIADPSQWQFHVLAQPVDDTGAEIPWPEGVFTPIDGDSMSQNLDGKLIDYLSTGQDRFFSVLRDRFPDIDVVWLSQPWWTMRLIESNPSLHRAHFVPTIHDYAFDTLDWQGPVADAFRAEAKVHAQISSQQIFSSHFMRSGGIERYGIAEDSSQVVYLADFVPEGFDPSEEEAIRVRERHRIPRDYWLTLHAVGHKDPMTIFRAVAKVKQEAPDAHLPLVVGGLKTDGLRPDASDLAMASMRSEIAKLGLEYEKDYFVLGYVPDEDVAGLYRGANSCIVASKSEAGFSGMIFEAMKAKAPLIHSDIGPFVERLGTDAAYGLHFACGDADDLARAMMAQRKAPDAAIERAENAFNTFCGRTWQDVASEYLTVFERAMNGSKPNVAAGAFDRALPGVSEQLTKAPKMLVRRFGKKLRRLISSR